MWWIRLCALAMQNCFIGFAASNMLLRFMQRGVTRMKAAIVTAR
jgi:hypothetical protein